MKFGKILALSAMALILTVPCAWAQDDVPAQPKKRHPDGQEDESTNPDRPGVFLGVAGVYSVENFDVNGNFGNSAGVDVRIGRRILSRLAVELDIQKNIQFDGPASKYDNWMLGMNAKGYILTGAIQPYLLVGGAFADGKLRTGNGPSSTQDDEQGFAMRFGGGLDYYVFNQMVLFTDISYVVNVGDLKDFDMMTWNWGIQFRP